ncbi:MAG: 2OG-Fe(II) oxygenase [Luteolibacter sp.]
MNSSDSLLTALSGITGTGDFHSKGVAPFFFPRLMVDGVGEIAFPLPASQVKELIAVAEAAPYGKGAETLLDESVRKCWQIDASRFSIESTAWEKFLGKTVESVRGDLGISGKISAHPYKLLVYGTGGHFKAHRDTEKLAAMFGTLIIALPSAHEGGRLFIRHEGREIEVDFSRKDHLHGFQHAAFFADCEHEVEPVRSGYRCCLVYNLRLDEGDPSSLNLALDAQARTLLAPLAALKAECRGQLSAVLLEHSYTEANFTLRALKGNDPSRARALLAAAREAGFTAHLALVTHHQMGELEESSRRRRHWDDDEDDNPVTGTMGEIYEESRTIGQWRDVGDQSVPLGTWCIDEECLLSREDFGRGDPDEKEAEGYTGNAGCTMDYWYRRAAVVLWPTKDEEKILCHYNFGGACRMLSAMVSDDKKPPGPRFERLGKAVVSRLPEHLPATAYRHHYRSTEDPFRLTLETLAKAEARELLDRLLEKIPDEAWVLCDAPLWKTLHKAFGVEAFHSLRERFLEGDPDAWRHILFPLLDALLKQKDGEPSARIIAARLAALKPKTPQSSDWRGPVRHPAAGDHDEVRILLTASHLLDAADDRKAAFRFLLADQSLDYIRTVLTPELLASASAAHRDFSGSLYPEIHSYAKDSLAAEVARPLPPFPDWTRPCPELPPATPPRMGYHPSHMDRQAAVLRDFVAFMADPTSKSREFRYPQDMRSSLESFITTHHLDLDCVTIRKGSPHGLSCTKNDKSHLRDLARRAGDQKLLDQLTGI